MPSVDNPIGALQELSQASGGHPTPLYVLQGVSGESHCPHFTYEASWAELRAVGEGSSKKEAKKAAAQNLLTLVRNGEENEGDSPVISEKKQEEKEEDGDSVRINEEEEERKYYRGNMVGQLQEYLMGRGLGVATYADGEITGPAHKLHFTMRASLGNVVEMGEGSTKKEAKHQAAGALLDKIRQSNSNAEPTKTQTGCEEEVDGE